MLLQLLTIARNTLVESLRQPIFLLLILINALLQALTTWSTGFAMSYESSAEVSGDNKLLLDIGLSTIFLFATLMAAFVATAVFSREIENKTVLTVVSKPVGRPVLVLGKYLGVAVAILIAALTMLCFLLLSIRHGVMTTAADELDGPVLAFGLGLGFAALFIAAWCNFYYGWSFPQTAVMLLAPAMVLAYVLVLAVSKKWEFQSLAKDFKPQIMIGCGAMMMATLVLTAVATAASTRLGQVMTMVICLGAFVASLLTNHLLGRHAFVNQINARIKEVQAVDPAKTTFRNAGEQYQITLEQTPISPMPAGTGIYYGPNPNGFDLMVPPPSDGPQVAVSQATNATSYIIRNQGQTPAGVVRAPEAGDLIFLKPTRTNAAALAAWAALPNLHHFWLLDAITQNQRVPPTYIAMLAVYTLMQITAILCLAIILFQKRDVG